MIQTLPLWTGRAAFQPFCTLYDERGLITKVHLAVDITDACARIADPGQVHLIFVKGSSFNPHDPLFSLHSIALLIRYERGNREILGQRPHHLFMRDGNIHRHFLAQFPELDVALENIGLTPQQFIHLTQAHLPVMS